MTTLSQEDTSQAIMAAFVALLRREGGALRMTFDEMRCAETCVLVETDGEGGATFTVLDARN